MLHMSSSSNTKANSYDIDKTISDDIDKTTSYNIVAFNDTLSRFELNEVKKNHVWEETYVFLKQMKANLKWHYAYAKLWILLNSRWRCQHLINNQRKVSTSQHNSYDTILTSTSGSSRSSRKSSLFTKWEKK